MIGWLICEYDVILESVGDRRVMVMKALRDSVDVSPLVVLSLLTNLPRVIIDSGYREDAYPAARRLFDAGADVRVIERSWEVQPGCYGGDASAPQITPTVWQEVPRDWWLNA